MVVVDPDDLKVGDHIYACRAAGYAHHGIYVGEVNGVRYVIHFNSTTNGGVVGSVSTASRWSKNKACQVCGHVENVNLGVVKTCLDCFLKKDELQLQCYIGNSKPSNEVVKMAYNLLERGFGEYNIAINNCEHFATFCKKGEPYSGQVENASMMINLLPTGPLPFRLFNLYLSFRKQGNHR
ncbi:hypothetical protein GH714_023389 [Hevea brasiliensis]|uniref:LRAT domain-containing protein n=1 Tax=Hevea brasiliensis TaxID=3981 RepID=A0A6A6M011_HEVBR|nr:hypothetical protein GH714_023389 [Hevea brasiliensis]